LEQAYAHIGRHPATGSPRYAHELNLPGLRLSLTRSPHLVFYVERPEHIIDVWRLLHDRIAGLRAIPMRIDAVLRRLEVQDRPTDITELLDSVAVLGIGWKIPGYKGIDPIKGLLHLRDQAGLGVDLFWEISADNARAGRYVEEGPNSSLATYP